MRKFLVIFSLLISALQIFSQTDKDSTDLVKRLSLFMEYNNITDFSKVMDYTYPKIFTLASKEELIASMEETFNNEELGMKMDSLKIVKIYPLFSEGRNKYARVTYSMTLLMTPKITEGDSIDINMYLNILQGQYGKENVRLDSSEKTLKIFQELDMAAIKDDISTEWTFLNIAKDDASMEIILSKELLARFYSN